MYCTDYEDHVQTIILVLHRLWRSCTHNNPCTVQIMKIVYNKPCLESKGWSCTDPVSLLHIKTISSHLFPRQLYNLKGTVSVISWYFIIFLFVMIWYLILKTFIPVSRIFDHEDDISIFSRNVRKSSASEILFLKNQTKILWNWTLPLKEM